MPQPKITLYVDIVSPFAYIAYHILRHDPVFAQCEKTYIPIFLGGVMMATGNTAPIKIKNKDKWIGLERNRWAQSFDVPILEAHPPNFPPNTLYLQRALAALTLVDGEQETLCKVMDRLFEAFWARHEEVYKPEVFEGMLGAVLGEEVVKKVMATMSKEGKSLLLKSTDQALADGAFGLPWFVCTNARGKTESFWGVDHLGQVADFLGLKKPQKGGFKSVL